MEAEKHFCYDCWTFEKPWKDFFHTIWCAQKVYENKKFLSFDTFRSMFDFKEQRWKIFAVCFLFASKALQLLSHCYTCKEVLLSTRPKNEVHLS